MKYVLCLLLALVVGGKSFAKGNGDLNLKNFILSQFTHRTPKMNWHVFLTG